jgi:hypothetical protein
MQRGERDAAGRSGEQGKKSLAGLGIALVLCSASSFYRLSQSDGKVIREQH